MPKLHGGLAALRKNRITILGARYFVTCVTQDRKKELDQVKIWEHLLQLISKSEADIYAVVLMPDHLHLFFELPKGSTLSTIIRAIKGPMTPVMRSTGIRWQKNYFEHRLRESEETEPYLRYMLSNPYRAQLVEITEAWPYWAVTSESAEWFINKFPNQFPEPEWITVAAPWSEIKE